MIIDAIGFAIKIIIAAGLIIPLSLPKTSLIKADMIGIYALLSVAASAITSISKSLETGIITGAFLIAMGIVSYTEFQKSDEWLAGLKEVAPFWLVAVIGMCVGAGMILQAIILTAIFYYIINYLPELISGKKNSKNNTEDS
jgi:uncharacterized membrane protein YhiD involved in acid resistance|tara:strand:+ start:193 stop:618 length:426 start_codon:yes stop_codon:yes gene_type:complete